MGNKNFILLFQAGVHLLAVVLSFCFIPILLILHNFNYNCPLFAKVEFLEKSLLFRPSWGPMSNCSFTIFVGIIAFIFSLTQLVRMLLLICKGRDSSFLSAFIDTLISFVMVLFVIIDAVIFTVGFSKWCSVVSYQFPSCSDGFAMNFTDKSIDATYFFVHLGIVQFGLWTSFVIWILSLMLAGRKLFVYHERENIIISMSRERQRYLAN